jgi:hypothetical protein
MLFSSYSSFASFVNALASYRIGSNIVDLESTPIFTDANHHLSFSQPRHAPSIPFFRTFIFVTSTYVLDYALKL